jgi:hypothetical protein
LCIGANNPVSNQKSVAIQQPAVPDVKNNFMNQESVAKRQQSFTAIFVPADCWSSTIIAPRNNGLFATSNFSRNSIDHRAYDAIAHILVAVA